MNNIPKLNINNKRYNQFSAYLKEKFNAKVYKITLDAGFTCPCRDGSLSSKGCIFCDGDGSFSQPQLKFLPIEEQIEKSIVHLHEKFKSTKYMSYFQAYTNTYKPVKELEKIYTSALYHPDIIGISIGTRPDCVDDEKLKLISTFKDDYETWIEYGLQSIHNKTLQKINRGHDYDCFLKAYEMSKKHGLNVCVHIILDCFETPEETMQTAQAMADLGVDGIKIHQLVVLKGTQLEKMYENKEFELMEEKEYIKMICDILEILPEYTTIHRLAGNGLIRNMIAPRWIQKKFEVLNRIDDELIRRNSWQGKFHQN